MKVAYADPLVTLHQGDSLDVLACLKPESVQCVVTSPPYWGLRLYEYEGADDGFGNEKLHDCLGWARGERCSRCYVCHSLVFLDAIRRVLRKDGVCFWNLGDSYASGGAGWRPGTGSANGIIDPRGIRNRNGTPLPGGMKPKDMVLIPQRVALAAQQSGWWVRSDIIWSKPGPMPESVTDRPTRSYEHILMLTKSARYHWDADAVREPLVKGAAGSSFTEGKTGVNGNGRVSRMPREDNPAGRNIRDVWNVSTEPFPGSHFAVFPQAIPGRAIRAATSEHGACSVCGAPWGRVVERGLTAHDGTTESAYAKGTTANRLALLRQAARQRGGEYVNESITVGWQPTCSHADAPVVPCVVLDPFAGSGTTLAVAKRLGRRAVGIEISESYVKLAINRVQGETARLL